METEQAKKNSFKYHTAYLSIIVLLLLVIAVGFYYAHKKSEIRMRMVAGIEQRRMNGKRISGGMGMVAITPPPLSDQQTQQLTAGTASAATQKTFNITGGNFYFVPNKITVNQGDKVTFVLTNAGGVHDLIIDELDVRTPVIRTANTATFQFTASKKGSFVYYCSVPGHRAKGMWGTLVIQ